MSEAHCERDGCVNSEQTALEDAFYEWWSENNHALSLGHPGDVAGLRERLNAAFAKSSTSFCLGRNKQHMIPYFFTGEVVPWR